ncbi:MAG TPA: ATP-binding protein [Acidimicrobiales bacterium]|nr:ATP-binding protein [Acidimicrobiales bacterium]
MRGVLRPKVGVVLGIGGVALVIGALLPARDGLGSTTPALALVIPVLVAAVIGGRLPAATTAVVAAATLNVVFLRPYGTLRLDVAAEIVALVTFLAVALAVGTLSAMEAARRSSAETRALELEAATAALRRADAERARLTEEAARVHVLEQVDEQRSALLRSVSHDLRTPLATIRAVTSDLLDGTAYDDATRTELLETVEDEAERLDRLVANLLSLSRIESGALKPDRQAVDVDELVRDRVQALSRLFHQVRLVVDVPDDLPLVDGDYTHLDQLVTNLLENAARHAPPRSTVTVAARASDGSVVVRVSDEGIGVPDHERHRVFEPFRTGEGSRSSGVGLAICKAIAEAHGGRIAVERTAGGGATFVVTLPARMPAA